MQLRVTVLSNRMERGVILYITAVSDARSTRSRCLGRRHAGKLPPLPWVPSIYVLTQSHAHS